MINVVEDIVEEESWLSLCLYNINTILIAICCAYYFNFVLHK